MKRGLSYIEMKKIMNHETSDIETINITKYVPSLKDYNFTFDMSDVDLYFLRVKVCLNQDGLSHKLIREFIQIKYELSYITKDNNKYYAIFIKKEKGGENKCMKKESIA